MLLVRPDDDPRVKRLADEFGSDDLIVRPDQGLSTRRLEDFLHEIRQQPPWRRVADKEADYYDGNQLTTEQIAVLEERGFAPLVTNLIKPTIDVVLGMEAKSRSDWIVRSEEGELGRDLAEALSSRLHKAEVSSRADRACSDAYADAIKVGLGWVEVSRNSNPFECRQRVQRVHRREIFFDWRDLSPGLESARFLVRKRWLDEDIACGAFPEHKELIGNCLNDWATWDRSNVDGAYSMDLARAFDDQRGFTIEQFEWLNTVRRRIAAYEVWYRVVVKGHVLRLPNDKMVEFNLQDDDHVAAVYGGHLTPIPAIFKKMRLAMFLGPHRVSDEPTPYRHHHFPYVPIWGFREDRTGVPYGLIRSMLSPQDEINARRSKMLWLLNARRVVADEDAVLDHDEAADEVGRPDAYIKLNPNKLPTSRFDVQDGGQLAAQQFQVLEAAKQEINQASGVYQSMLGDAKNGASSGLAINSLVEQGVTTLAEINDNYRFARRQVGELLLGLVVEDLAQQGETQVTVGEEGEERVIPINQPGQDALGRPTVINDVTQIRAEVVLDDVPSTPTYRMQQLQMLTELVKSAPPNVQSVIFDMVVEAMDVPKKRDLVKRIREAMGITVEGQPQNPMVLQLQEQLQQAQGLMQQAAQEDGDKIRGLEDALAKAELKLVDKAGELEIKSRQVAIQEIQAATEASAKADPQEVMGLVQQALAPLVEQIAALISKQGQSSGPGAAAESLPV